MKEPNSTMGSPRRLQRVRKTCQPVQTSTSEDKVNVVVVVAAAAAAAAAAVAAVAAVHLQTLTAFSELR